jgi:hypothetical protein
LFLTDLGYDLLTLSSKVFLEPKNANVSKLRQARKKTKEISFLDIKQSFKVNE